MKRLDLAFLALRLPLDAVAVFAAAIASYFLRFQTFAEWRPATEIVSFPAYVALAFAGSGLWLACFFLVRLYAPGRTRILDEVGRIIVGCSAAIAVIVLLIFFRRELFASRFIILAVWGISMLFVLVERMVLRLLQTYLYKKGVGSRKIVVVGAGHTALVVAEEFRRHPAAGYTVRAIIPDLSEGSVAKLQALREDAVGLEEVFLAEPRPAAADIARLIAFSDAHQVAIRYTADVLGGRRVSLDVAMFGGVPFVEIARTPLRGWGRIYKRGFDLVVAGVLLLVLSPLLLATALAVAVTSPGPMFYVRKRVGEDGRLFPFYKFRSMRIDAPEDLAERKRHSERPGIIPKLPEHGRWVTPAGRFIRRWSIDELPQLVNVLLGHMSLVGPRPHLPEEVAQYATHQRKLLIVKPGITGLAQISGRADLSFEEEAALDLSYIERWSPKLDLSILLKTPLAVISKKGAY